jgi:hypothetical protein
MPPTRQASPFYHAPDWLYGVLGGLIIILVGVIAWAIHIQNRMQALYRENRLESKEIQAQKQKTDPPASSEKKHLIYRMKDAPLSTI